MCSGSLCQGFSPSWWVRRGEAMWQKLFTSLWARKPRMWALPSRATSTAYIYQPCHTSGAAEGSKTVPPAGDQSMSPGWAFHIQSIMQSVSESITLGPLLSAFCDFPFIGRSICTDTRVHTLRVRFILGNKLQTASKIVCCPFISGPFATSQKFLVLLDIQIHSPRIPTLSLREGHTSS